MAAERGEIIMPLLAHLCFLAQGTGAVFRSSPTEAQALHRALDGPFMDIESHGLFEERLHRLGMTDRAVPMCFKHQVTYLACGDERHSGGVVTMARQGRDGHGPRLSHGCGDPCHQTPCHPRLRARQRLRLVPLEARLGIVLFFYGVEHMLHHPFFFIGQWSASLTSTFNRLKMRMSHTQLTGQGRSRRFTIHVYIVTGWVKTSRFYSILCCRAQ